MTSPLTQCVLAASLRWTAGPRSLWARGLPVPVQGLQLLPLLPGRPDGPDAAAPGNTGCWGGCSSSSRLPFSTLSSSSQPRLPCSLWGNASHFTTITLDTLHDDYCPAFHNAVKCPIHFSWSSYIPRSDKVGMMAAEVSPNREIKDGARAENTTAL